MSEEVRKVIIPYKPREQFKQYHKRAQRWSAIVAHRRAGKTVATVNDLIKRALECPLVEPRFAYIAPYYVQAKDIAWAYLKRFAAPIIDAAGGAMNESELRITLPNGASIRLYGAENGDRLRGLYLDGVVLDEFADFPPSLWGEVLRPALSDRKGWATFIGTPKGRNAFYDLWVRSQTDPEWFSLILKASETGILDSKELQSAKSEMTAEQFAQEYEGSFEAAIQGAYYADQLGKAESDGRICSVPHEVRSSVVTAWDLGMGDHTAIWFAQRVGREIRLIDYYESFGAGLDHYVKVLKDKDYTYDYHILPHDVEVRELGTGVSRLEVLSSLGLRSVTVAKKMNIDDGINAVRTLLPRCWIDRKKCATGIEALRQYRADYDEKRKVFSGKPRHDWCSHAADSLRYLAIGMKEETYVREADLYPEVS
jgi:hypothetical protein